MIFFRAALLAVCFPVAAHAANLTVTQPWMRFLLPSIPASGYLVLKNNGASSATLTSAASPACGGGLMLHQSQDTSGMAMMMAVPTLSIPAHGQVFFAPGGYHLMCMQPKMQPGGHVPIRLNFADGSAIAFSMPVYGAQNAP